MSVPQTNTLSTRRLLVIFWPNTLLLPGSFPFATAALTFQTMKKYPHTWLWVLALDRYDVSKWILIIMLEVWNHKVALGCVAKYSSSCLVLSMVFLVPFACLLAIVLSSISTVGSTACINALDVFYVVLREGRGCVRGEGVLCLPAILFGLGGVRAVVAWLGRHACIFAIAS